MLDDPDSDLKRRDPPEPAPRKPWHAPQFIVSDLEATETVCNGGLDGGPSGSHS